MIYEKNINFQKGINGLIFDILKTESPPKITKQYENKTIIDNNNLIDITPEEIIKHLYKTGAINTFLYADSKQRIKKGKPLKNSVKIHYDFYLKNIKTQTGKNSRNHREKAESPLYKTFIPVTIRGVSYAPLVNRGVYIDYIGYSKLNNTLITEENTQEESFFYRLYDSQNIEKNTQEESIRQIKFISSLPVMKKTLIRGIIGGALDNNTKGAYFVNSPKVTNTPKVIYSPIYPENLGLLGFTNNGGILTESPENSPLISSYAIIEKIKGIIAVYDYAKIHIHKISKNGGLMNNQ